MFSHVFITKQLKSRARHFCFYSVNKPSKWCKPFKCDPGTDNDFPRQVHDNGVNTIPTYFLTN